MKKQKYTELYINPVYRIPTQGRDRQVYTIDMGGGNVVPVTNMNKTRESGTTHQFSFQLDWSKNRLDTGLDELIDNPFKGLSESEVKSTYNVHSSWDLSTIVNQDKISKQQCFEIKDGQEPNFYTAEYANGTVFSGMSASQQWKQPNYLEKFSITLYDKPNRFTDETPRGRLAIELIKRHNKIAASKEDINPSSHFYYISEANEAEKEKVKKREIIDNAIFHKEKLFREHDVFTQYKTAILLIDKDGHPILKGDMNEIGVKNKINDFITTNSTSQMANISKFESIYELLTSREGIIKFNIKYLIQQAENSHVISKRDGLFIWHSKVGSGESVSKFTSYDRLVSFMTKEYSTYDEKDEETTNWYGELLKEVRSKDIRL